MKLELDFSNDEWNIINKAAEGLKIVAKKEGIVFSDEDAYWEYIFTSTCEEFLKQQRRYEILNEFINDIMKG